MLKQTFNERSLLEKIHHLCPEKISEVVDFVDFLMQQSAHPSKIGTTDAELVRASARLAAVPFARVWDNPDDAVYDEL